MFSRDTQRQILQEAAIRYGGVFEIPPVVILGICKAESDFNIFAQRFEPKYRYLWNVFDNKPWRIAGDSPELMQAPITFPHQKLNSLHTEWTGQKTSWGPMQVMGAVAREYGFDGFFPELCTVDVGLLYGCKYLSALKDRFWVNHDWPGVVAAFNAGSPRFNEDGSFVNQKYVDKVFG